jgi:hypothetical protein
MSLPDPIIERNPLNFRRMLIKAIAFIPVSNRR